MWRVRREAVRRSGAALTPLVLEASQSAITQPFMRTLAPFRA
jgi:hypothetical protein